jgi:type VI secretion system protein ImpL
MTQELRPFAVGDNIPSWVRLVYQLKEAIAASKLVSLEGKGFISKAASKGKKFLPKFGRHAHDLDEGQLLESQVAAAKALKVYLDALAEINQASSSRVVAYDLAKGAYESEDPSSDKSPFFRAQNALNKFKTSVASAEPSEEMFWNLLRGPLDFLLVFVSGEAACHLQSLWTKEVLVEVQGVSEQRRANRILFGEDGYAVNFIKGPAAAFIGRDRNKGYYAKKIMGRHVPFTSEFLGFVTKGEKVKPGAYRDFYSVAITGLPTDTKFRSSYEGSRVRVDETGIELQCAGESRTLVNYNYPVKKTFNWSPNNCSDVVFTIHVGKLILTKKYTGFYAFPKFLDDFSGGQCVFYPSGFPDEEAALKRMGIKYIKVKYRLKGHEPVLRLFRDNPGRAPEAIAECRQ